MIDTYNIYYLADGESHRAQAHGPTLAGRRASLILMDGGEVTGIIKASEDQ